MRGLKVQCDRVGLGSSAWNLAAPLDGGQHVEVSTSGKRAWRRQLRFKNESDAQVLDVPALEDLAGGATLFIVGRSRASGERDTGGVTAPRLAVGAGPQG